MKRDVRDFISDMLQSVNEIEDFAKGMSREQFKADKKPLNAVVRSLEVLGEAAKNIPGEIQAAFPGIPMAKHHRDAEQAHP